MEPTLRSGTFVLYDRSYYRSHRIAPGDVVLVRHNGGVWIKRIYAAGGTQFWTWREATNEGIRHDPIQAAQRRRFARVIAHERSVYHEDCRLVRLTVPAGSVFLVGDNAHSFDSREFGPVDAQEILGRVVQLPGQRLGDPGWTERSFPTVERVAAGEQRGASL